MPIRKLPETVETWNFFNLETTTTMASARARIDCNLDLVALNGISPLGQRQLFEGRRTKNFACIDWLCPTAFIALSLSGLSSDLTSTAKYRDYRLLYYMFSTCLSD